MLYLHCSLFFIFALVERIFQQKTSKRDFRGVSCAEYDQLKIFKNFLFFA